MDNFLLQTLPDFCNGLPSDIGIILSCQAVEVSCPDLRAIVSEELLEVVLYPGQLRHPGGLGLVMEVAAGHKHGLRLRIKGYFRRDVTGLLSQPGDIPSHLPGPDHLLNIKICHQGCLDKV